MSLLTPAIRAMSQLTHPVFMGVVLRSVLWSVVAFVVLAIGVSAGLGWVLANHPGWNWLGAAAGFVGTAVLSLFLFVPLATAIAVLFCERITLAVEAEYYPDLPPLSPASVMDQTIDAVLLGLRILVVQVAAIVITLILPGIGAAIGWFVSSWAVGRGLFEPIAMLRTDRVNAVMLYRANRPAVLFQGALMTAAGLVPGLNVLAPILGVAAMVHILHARVVPPPLSVVGQRLPNSRS